MDRENNIYVMDTGNSRVKVLDSNFVFSHHITCETLEGRGVTGGLQWNAKFDVLLLLLF